LRLLRITILATLIVGTVGVGPAWAHDVTYINYPTAVVTESSGSVGISVHRGEHGFEVATIDYSTTAGNAQEGADFEGKQGSFKLGAPRDEAEVLVKILNDDVVEDVETFEFSLDKAVGGTILRFPTKATITIVDDDGPSRISFSQASYTNYENRGATTITLIRSGDASQAASVDVSTSDGSALADGDYTPLTSTVTFEVGTRTKTVAVDMTNDTTGEETENLNLTLGTPAGAELTTPQTATLEIFDDDSTSSDTTAPRSQFHKPRNGVKYKPSQVRTLHVITSDDASGVDTLQTALRKKMRNGRCAWLTGKGFKKGGCNNRKWIDLKVKPFVYWRLDTTLRQTTKKSGIKNYTAYARSTDNSGNIETRFKKGRNMNTFTVKK
jgi:hypothetical protein